MTIIGAQQTMNPKASVASVLETFTSLRNLPVVSLMIWRDCEVRQTGTIQNLPRAQAM